MNKNGSWRKTPLKKNRAFSRIELFMTDSEYTRIKKIEKSYRDTEPPGRAYDYL